MRCGDVCAQRSLRSMDYALERHQVIQDLGHKPSRGGSRYVQKLQKSTKSLKSCDDPSLISDIKIAEERMCAYKDLAQCEIQKNQVQGVQLAMLIQLWPEGHPLSIHPPFLFFFILTKQPCYYTLVSIFIFSQEIKHAQALSYLMGLKQDLCYLEHSTQHSTCPKQVISKNSNVK